MKCVPTYAVVQSGEMLLISTVKILAHRIASDCMLQEKQDRSIDWYVLSIVVGYKQRTHSFENQKGMAQS